MADIVGGCQKKRRLILSPNDLIIELQTTLFIGIWRLIMFWTYWGSLKSFKQTWILESWIKLWCRKCPQNVVFSSSHHYAENIVASLILHQSYIMNLNLNLVIYTRDQITDYKTQGWQNIWPFFNHFLVVCWNFDSYFIVLLTIWCIIGSF